MVARYSLAQQHDPTALFTQHEPIELLYAPVFVVGHSQTESGRTTAMCCTPLTSTLKTPIVLDA